MLIVKDVTGKDIIEAMRKNGYKKIRGGLIRYKERADGSKGPIAGACAIGQAAINLGVPAMMLEIKLPVKVSRRIINLNDNYRFANAKTVPEIADIVEKEFPELLDQIFTLSKFKY